MNNYLKGLLYREFAGQQDRWDEGIVEYRGTKTLRNGDVYERDTQKDSRSNETYLSWGS